MAQQRTPNGLALHVYTMLLFSLETLIELVWKLDNTALWTLLEAAQITFQLDLWLVGKAFLRWTLLMCSLISRWCFVLLWIAFPHDKMDAIGQNWACI